mmetsp:Transcript_18268/g.39933  ORF Transcript_18268/g.39933 Transcript_18268/m.39933 type:complete len:190 (-) Transcript_18268:271-840(-)|eukprot:CAMPEP_0118935520 /NCGR_PEP_ID=MMETSP1169-20130426/15686_1 /TAXON_ID=36882 /ORGANISM="Pyramimonas obovata, Strain CCMP722" /LENGTH=189 /DNA_ID=CAMNT_0006878567 /DNA_START=284 /DNA_END=853 /DNA_ORIENTATION=-
MGGTLLLVIIIVCGVLGIAIVSCIITAVLVTKKRKAEAAAAAAEGTLKSKKLTKDELKRKSTLKVSDRATDIELGEIRVDTGDGPRTRFDAEKRSKLQEDKAPKVPRRTAAEDRYFAAKIREQRKRHLQMKAASAPAVTKGGGDDPDASEEEVEWETGSTESAPTTVTSRGSSCTTSESSLEEGACAIA